MAVRGKRTVRVPLKIPSNILGGEGETTRKFGKKIKQKTSPGT